MLMIHTPSTFLGRRLLCMGCAVGLSLVGQAHASDEPLPAGSPLGRQILYQFAIYYPASPATAPMKALQAQFKRMPLVPALVDKLSSQPTAAMVQARHDTNVQSDYAPPSLGQLQYFGRGLSREQGVALQAARQALIMNFAHPASLSIPAYRASLSLTENIARTTNGLIWDAETREVFTPDEWHKQRLDTWAGDTPDVLKHTVIHAYQNNGKLVRAITLGMGKFGLPDLVVEDFSWSANRSMGNLVNVTAQALIEGQSIGPKGQLNLDLRSIRHAAARDAQLSTLIGQANAKAPLVLVHGTRDKGDPENRLAEIRFDRVAGKDVYARQDALLSGLFGSEDSATPVKHNGALLKASEAARVKLPSLRDAFNQGLQPGDYLMVKAPFPTSAGGREWMWVEVTTWRGEDISGLLKNEPMDAPGLHAGQIVKVSQRDVFDYLRRYADGRSEGNETGRIIKRSQKGGG